MSPSRRSIRCGVTTSPRRSPVSAATQPPARAAAPLGLDAVLLGTGDARASSPRRARAAHATVLIASHLDTCVDGMEIDPFAPTIADDRLYGRGSCDTKAGMAAAVAALAHVLERARCAATWSSPARPTRVLEHRRPRRARADRCPSPDWVLATGPTEARRGDQPQGHRAAAAGGARRVLPQLEPRAGAERNRPAGARSARARRARRGDRPPPAPTPRPPDDLGRRDRRRPRTNIVPQKAWLLSDRRLLPGRTEAMLREELRTRWPGTAPRRS